MHLITILANVALNDYHNKQICLFSVHNMEVYKLNELRVPLAPSSVQLESISLGLISFKRQNKKNLALI